MAYLNLNLRIWQSSEKRYRVAIGELGKEERKLPARPIEPLVKVSEEFDPKDPTTLTDENRAILGEELLDGDTGQIVLDALKGQAEGVRLRLKTGDLKTDDLKTGDEFMENLPWEGAHWSPRDEDGRILPSLALGTSHKLTIVRAEADIERRPPPSLRPPLRVLLIIGACEDLNPSEEQYVVKNLENNHQVEVHVQVIGDDGGARLRDLKDTLAQGWHIVHYFGHSGITDGTGWVQLRDDYGDNDVYKDKAFEKTLLLNRQARLVVLHSCQSLSVARSLLEAGVQAVVAMRTNVAAHDAHKFSEALYASLLGEVEPGRVDTAVQLGRAFLEPPCDAAPILFMRPADGRIFKIARTPEYWKPEAIAYVKDQAARLSYLRHKYAPLPLTDGSVESLDDEEQKHTSDLDYARHIVARCPVQRAMEAMDNIVVLGDGGAGKTTALRFRAWSRFIEFAEGDRPTADRLPVLLNLAAMDVDQTLTEAIAAETRLSLQAVERYIHDGAIELLADGFNEIPEKAIDSVLKELDEFLRGECAITSRLIVTSRPTIAQWQALAIPSVTIAPLVHDSIREMVDRVAPNPEAAGLLKQYIPLDDDTAWENPTSVLRMMSLPLVIQMLVDLAGMAVERGDDLQLPGTRGELFSQWTKRQLIWSDRPSLGQIVELDKKLDGLKRLAVHMLEKQLGTVARREDVLEVWDGDPPEDAIDEMIDAGVLDERGEAKVTWWHQGIRDTCAAWHLDEQLGKGDISEKYLKNREWDDAFVYLAGMLRECKAVTLIERHLFDYPFLAARCYMETRHIHDLEAAKPLLLENMWRAHRRTQEITDDIEQLELLVREGLENPTFFGHLVLGKILEIQGRYDDAIAECDAALTLDPPDFSDRVDALCLAGNFRRRSGNHAGAVPYYLEALALARERADHRRDDLPYYELGYVFNKEGLTRLAIKSYDLSYQAGKVEAERLFAETGDEAIKAKKLGYAAMALGVKAGLLARSHRFDEAKELLQEILPIFVEASQERWIQNVYGYLARLYVSRYLRYGDKSDPEEAENQLDQASSRWSAFRDNPFVRAQNYFNLALLHLAKEAYDDAVRYVDLAKKVLKDITAGDEQRAEMLHALGLAYRGIAEYEKAEMAFRDALDRSPREMNLWGIARALRDLADLQVEQGKDLIDAAQNIETARRLFKALESQEAETCQPVIEKLKGTYLPERGYAKVTSELPRLEALRPSDAAYMRHMENSRYKEVLELVYED